MKKAIFTDKAPQAIGIYSQAVQLGQQVFLSGQIGLDPQSGVLVEGGFSAELKQVFMNIQAVLHEAGLSFQDVVRLTVYLMDFVDFPLLNDMMAQYFQEPYPARTTIAVAGLPKGARVEIEVTAVK